MSSVMPPMRDATLRAPRSHGRLLDVIRSSGPVSRVEIATRTGLTQASVSTIVRTLIDDGLVREVGQSGPTGGKRRTMLEITPSARCSVGIHLGADSIVYVVTNMAGALIGRQRRDGAGDAPPDRIVARISSEVDDLLGALGLPRSRVVGIGVVAAGPIDYSAGAVIGGQALAHWESFPLRDALADATGLPVIVDKDATAAAIGEFWGGRVDAPLSFVCLYMGTGIGAGIVSNGMAFRGSASNAGEIGHVSVDPNGRACPCGNHGCVEVLAAPRAVIARADGLDNAEADALPTTTVSRRFDGIARAAVNNEPTAGMLMRRSADVVAEGALTLVNLVDPDLVVLAGPGFAIAGALYIERIRAVIADRFFARRIHRVEVRLATNPRDAAAIGASALVLQESLTPRG